MGNSYKEIIEKIFLAGYKKGARRVPFKREDIPAVCRKHRIAVPKNLGDVVYSFRYRADLPEGIRSVTEKGMSWIIRPAGQGLYAFELVPDLDLSPRDNMIPTKVPDATPGLIAKYTLTDEQSLLARVRYNRLIDLFLGIVCHSLQSHLRTTAPNMGQVETDELYVGVDKKGVHYVVPVQAKAGRDRLNIVQLEQDFAVRADKFPNLVCRPVAAQFMNEGVICLFELAQDKAGVGIASERHYRLVPPEEVDDGDLRNYRCTGGD